MEKVFSFNIDRCVACHACMMACSIESGTDLPLRKVLGEDEGRYPGLPVHNISMACNHCEDAPCIEGCPARAYYRDEETGAVLLKAENCIGCNYCYWNCPYDAPLYNQEKKIIEKCNFCYKRLHDGLDPACVTACPTGALSFTLPPGDGTRPEDLPGSFTGPRLAVSARPGSVNGSPEIYPEEDKALYQVKEADKKVKAGSEWTLILFTYLTSLLFALNISNWFGVFTSGLTVYLFMVLASLLIPILHLGKPMGAWRSIRGMFYSPISNEIIFLLLFTLLSSLAYIFIITELWIASFVSGFLLLISIDSVYTYSDRRFIFKLHPAQVFLSGLFMASFLLMEPLPVLFVGLLRTALWFHYYYKAGERRGFLLYNIVQTLVLAYLLLVVFELAGFSYFSIIVLFLSELLSRIYYYLHFKAQSLLSDYFANKIKNYEKEKR